MSLYLRCAVVALNLVAVGIGMFWSDSDEQNPRTGRIIWATSCFRVQGFGFKDCIDKPFQGKKRPSQAPRHVQSTVHEL